MNGLILLADGVAPQDVRVSAPVFQTIAVGFLALLLVRDLWNWSKPYPGKFVRMLRCFVWIGTGIAIADPWLVQAAATALGIGRAADAVLYVFVLAFLWVSFYLYTRCLKLEREITALTRHVAIQEAVKGDATDAG
jgi:small membrane protein